MKNVSGCVSGNDVHQLQQPSASMLRRMNLTHAQKMSLIMKDAQDDAKFLDCSVKK